MNTTAAIHDNTSAIAVTAKIENVYSPAEDLAIATQPERSAFDFPDRRTSLGVFDMNALPGLAHHDARIAAEGLDVAVDRAGFATWIAEPAVKVAADFADVALLELFESRQEIGTTGVPFVESEPTECDAVGQSVADLVKRNIVFGLVDDFVGNARFLTPLGIVPGVFWQEQVAVEHGAKMRIEAGVAEVDTDDAVIDLARVATPLPLDTGGLVAGFGMSRIVDDADGLGIGVIAHDNVLNLIDELAVIPGGPIEKLLQRPAWRAVEVRDGLNALAFQVGELSADIAGEMATRLGAPEAAIELAQEIGQLWSQ